jgi:hypothetical protein
MIHYALVCASDHAFEGWFRSSGDFDRQAGAGQVACPVCGSVEVARGLMAPSVRSGRAVAPAAAGAAPAEPAAPVEAPASEPLRELRARVVENADYVGSRFADEARRIHYGETEHRGIYGEATAEEAKSLADEGITCHPLPVIPDDRN